MRKLVSVALAAALVLSISGTAFAAKGGNGGGSATLAPSSITLDQTGSLKFGESVTFTTIVNDLKGNEYALVYLECLQGATVVYGQLALPGTVFVLGGGSSPWWNSPGSATCVAHLDAYGSHGGYDTIRELAVTVPSFYVAW